jgi:GxxExxY protein
MLGPGLLESVYKECLYHQILEKAITVAKEVPTPLVFENIKLECGYRADLKRNAKKRRGYARDAKALGVDW